MIDLPEVLNTREYNKLLQKGEIDEYAYKIYNTKNYYNQLNITKNIIA